MNKSSEVIKTGFKLNEDERLRYLQEAREDGERILRTYQHQYKCALEERAVKWANRELLLVREATLLVDEVKKESVIAVKDLAAAEKKLAAAEENLADTEKNLAAAKEKLAFAKEEVAIA